MPYHERYFLERDVPDIAKIQEILSSADKRFRVEEYIGDDYPCGYVYAGDRDAGLISIFDDKRGQEIYLDEIEGFHEEIANAPKEAAPLASILRSCRAVIITDIPHNLAKNPPDDVENTDVFWQIWDYYLSQGNGFMYADFWGFLAPGENPSDPNGRLFVEHK